MATFSCGWLGFSVHRLCICWTDLWSMLQREVRYADDSNDNLTTIYHCIYVHESRFILKHRTLDSCQKVGKFCGYWKKIVSQNRKAYMSCHSLVCVATSLRGQIRAIEVSLNYTKLATLPICREKQNKFGKKIVSSMDRTQDLSWSTLMHCLLY